MTALFRRGGDGWFHVYVQQELGHYVAEAVARRGRRAGAAMKEIFFPKRMWRPRAELKRRYEVVDRRRRVARARDRVLPGQAARDHGRLHPREVVHRLGRVRPEHDDHPLELPDTGGRGVLRGERPSLRAPLEGARLQPHVLAARAPDARPLGPRDDHDAGARRGQQAPRDQVERRPSAAHPGALPGARPLGAARVPDRGRPLSPARRDHPPRRRRVGLRARGRSARRRDPPVDRGHRLRARAAIA